MSTIFFLILFPLIVAIALLIFKTDAVRDVIVKISAAVIAAGSIVLAVQNFAEGGQMYDFESEACMYSDTVNGMVRA